MEKEKIQEVIASLPKQTTFTVVYRDGNEFKGTFHEGHQAGLSENRYWGDKNCWLFKMKPGFGKPFDVLIEGDKVEVLREVI